MNGINLKDFIDIIEEIAPLSYAESWDRCGLQVGAGDLVYGAAERRRVKSALITLELTNDTLSEAKELSCDFILTHHPLFDREGDFHRKLSEAGIVLYAAHTSFDSAPGGNNDYLARILGLRDIRPFDSSGMVGRKGELSEAIKAADFLELIKSRLSLEKGALRITKSASLKNKTIRRVGLCTGSGSEFAKAAAKEGCDIFVTGDLKHHAALNFIAEDILVADAGHFGTEKIFAENMAARLSEKLRERSEAERLSKNSGEAGGALSASASGTLREQIPDIFISRREKDPFLYV